MSDLFTLDVETAAKDKSMQMHAGLEPWRVRQSKSEITSVAVCKPDNSVIQIVNDGPDFVRKYKLLLEELRGCKVFCHNAPFDVAFSIATLEPSRTGKIPSLIRDIRWRDTSLLTKWRTNGQLADDARFSMALVNLVEVFLPHHPLTKDFLDLKRKRVNPGDNPQYWLERGNMDVILTKALAEFLMEGTPASMVQGILTEFDCIVPVANSWLMGIKIDQDVLERLEPELNKEIDDAASALGIHRGVFTSTTQLPHLLYGTWGLPVKDRTPKGAPSCAKDTLMWLRYDMLQVGNTEAAAKMSHILKAKNASTLLSKYVKTTKQALQHTGDGYIYGAPRIFGTYTGRFTYKNTTTSKDFEDDTESRWKTGIALHQLPRIKSRSSGSAFVRRVREMLVPPDGMALHEDDASGQESRLMALRSKDPVMTQVFKDNLNFHGMTGSSIIGMDYHEFMAKFKTEGAAGGYFTEQRQLGKLANLSCNYRIGGRALSQKAYVEYDTYLTVETGIYVVNAFNRTYKGVPEYWDDVIWESKEKGYTEVFGGRRYKLHKWTGSDVWMSESSAIATPIQGAGASMKEIAIKEVYDKVPDALFSLDLHDANFFYVPIDQKEKVGKQIDEVLNSIDYEPYWGFKPIIPLPYESASGMNFGQVK